LISKINSCSAKFKALLPKIKDKEQWQPETGRGIDRLNGGTGNDILTGSTTNLVVK
jgi:cytochrome c5